MEIDLKAIGKRTNSCRIKRGITQEQLAEQMDVSIQMISNLERGNKEIKISNLIKLSSILEVSADYLLTGKGVNTQKTLSEKIALLSREDQNLIESFIDRLLSEI